VIEGLLIFIAAVWIIYEAIVRLITASHVGSHAVGITVMGISAIVNLFVSRKLYKVAKETDSLALEADALHLKTDVYTSLGVALGLFLIWILDHLDIKGINGRFGGGHTGCPADIYESFSLLKKAFYPLLDTALPDEDVVIIKESIQQHLTEGMSFTSCVPARAAIISMWTFTWKCPQIHP